MSDLLRNYFLLFLFYLQSPMSIQLYLDNLGKNLFNNTSYDDKDSKNRDRKRNKDKDTDDNDKKKDNIVCRCNIF